MLEDVIEYFNKYFNPIDRNDFFSFDDDFIWYEDSEGALCYRTPYFGITGIEGKLEQLSSKEFYTKGLLSSDVAGKLINAIQITMVADNKKNYVISSQDVLQTLINVISQQVQDQNSSLTSSSNSLDVSSNLSVQQNELRVIETLDELSLDMDSEPNISAPAPQRVNGLFSLLRQENDLLPPPFTRSVSAPSRLSSASASNSDLDETESPKASLS